MNDINWQEFYGATAEDWLRRWDSDELVWSVEMGGIGPAYEQAIQICAAEIIRELIAADFQYNDDREQLREDWRAFDDRLSSMEKFRKMDLTGAMWGAACSLATQLHRRTPAVALQDDAVKDRKIQVRRTFPNGSEVQQ